MPPHGVPDHVDGHKCPPSICRRCHQSGHPQHAEARSFIRPGQGVVENIAEEDLEEDYEDHQAESNYGDNTAIGQDSRVEFLQRPDETALDASRDHGTSPCIDRDGANSPSAMTGPAEMREVPVAIGIPRKFKQIPPRRDYGTEASEPEPDSLITSRQAVRGQGAIVRNRCNTKGHVTGTAASAPMFSRFSQAAAPGSCASEATKEIQALRPWQCLYFLPEPQGQGLFRPGAPPVLVLWTGLPLPARAPCWALC